MMIKPLSHFQCELLWGWHFGINSSPFQNFANLCAVFKTDPDQVLTLDIWDITHICCSDKPKLQLSLSIAMCSFVVWSSNVITAPMWKKPWPGWSQSWQSWPGHSPAGHRHGQHKEVAVDRDNRHSNWHHQCIQIMVSCAQCTPCKASILVRVCSHSGIINMTSVQWATHSTNVLCKTG